MGHTQVSAVIITGGGGSSGDKLEEQLLRSTDSAPPGSFPIISIAGLLGDGSPCWPADLPEGQRGCRTKEIREDQDSGEEHLPQPPLGDLPPLPWCYVMFTSGSTGSPLGVLGTEQGILNRCQWMAREGAGGNGLILPGDVMAVKTSVSFVDSIWEAFAPLLLPASSVLLAPDLMLRPGALLKPLPPPLICTGHILIPTLIPPTPLTPFTPLTHPFIHRSPAQGTVPPSRDAPRFSALALTDAAAGTSLQ